MLRTFDRCRWLCATLAVVLLAGCAHRTVADRTLAPSMVLERFLRAANSNDLDTMAQLFGNRNGPIQGQASAKDVDDRMFAIAAVIRHTDYSIKGEQIVPGRRTEATSLIVQLTIGDKPYELPITLVHTDKYGWLIENVPLDRITNR